MFKLHEKLKSDLVEVGELKLSKLMILPDDMNQWIVLVPMVNDIKELHELSLDNQHTLLNEINMISKLFSSEFSPDKINIGSLGNMVPQLHIHIIARYKNDRAWPGSIWGKQSYTKPEKLESLKETLAKLF